MTVDHRLWPGKGHPLPDAEHAWHPATFHCLDVMACAIGLMESAPARMQRLSALYSIPQSTLERTFAFLIAMHDIGKLSAKFCSDVGHSLPVGAGSGRQTHLRHWEISYLLLIGKLDNAVEAAIGCSDEFARDRLYIAVSGHHGQPPSYTDEFSFTGGRTNSRVTSRQSNHKSMFSSPKHYLVNYLLNKRGSFLTTPWGANT